MSVYGPALPMGDEHSIITIDRAGVFSVDTGANVADLSAQLRNIADYLGSFEQVAR